MWFAYHVGYEIDLIIIILYLILRDFEDYLTIGYAFTKHFLVYAQQKIVNIAEIADLCSFVTIPSTTYHNEWISELFFMSVVD